MPRHVITATGLEALERFRDHFSATILGLTAKHYPGKGDLTGWKIREELKADLKGLAKLICAVRKTGYVSLGTEARPVDEVLAFTADSKLLVDGRAMHVLDTEWDPDCEALAVAAKRRRHIYISSAKAPAIALAA